MKPSWEDAPKWANWLAMDLDGRWYWFEQRPKFSRTWWEWTSPAKYKVQHAKIEIHPRTTLEKRP